MVNHRPGVDAKGFSDTSCSMLVDMRNEVLTLDTQGQENHSSGTGDVRSSIFPVRYSKRSAFTVEDTPNKILYLLPDS